MANQLSKAPRRRPFHSRNSGRNWPAAPEVRASRAWLLCAAAGGARLGSGLDRNFAPPSRAFRDRHRDFQNAILELSPGLFGIGAFRQGNHAIEVSVGALAAVIPLSFLFVFTFALALDGESFLGELHFHVVLVDAGEIGADD